MQQESPPPRNRISRWKKWVLAKLAAFTNEPRFQTLHFQELHGNCTYSDSKLTVDDFVAEDADLFQVEGSFTVNDKQLRGTVQLGVSGKVLASFPGAREEVFTKHRNDYYWTSVQLSGTTDEPRAPATPPTPASSGPSRALSTASPAKLRSNRWGTYLTRVSASECRLGGGLRVRNNSSVLVHAMRRIVGVD